jgi:hypothetical protein
MDNETKEKLIAWEALAREAFKLLTPEQRRAAKEAAAPMCLRQPADIAGPASTVLRDL